MAKIFFAFATCIAALIALQVLIGMELFSLPDRLVTQSRAEIEKWREASIEATGHVSEAWGKLELYSQAFAGMRGDWELALEQAAGLQEGGDQLVGTLQPLLEADQPDDEQQVGKLVTELGAKRVEYQRLATDVAQQISHLADCIRNRERIRDECRGMVGTLDSRNLDQLRAKVEQAALDWPSKQQDLDTRLQHLKERDEMVHRQLKIVEAETERPVHEMDVRAFAFAADSIREVAADPGQAEQELLQLCQQLYTGWDEILADMDIQEGEQIRFYHSIRRVEIDTEVPTTAGAELAVQHDEDVKLRQVSKQVFEKNKKNIGMAIRSKPAGKYDHEVETVAQPPGFSYIAPVEQQRNRYGEWREHRTGGTYWAWYGQYAFMRSMFWGSNYRPIYTSTYNDYYRSYNSGRSWYGTSAGRSLYGTQGKYSSRQYSSSKYLRTGGLKHTQYVRSGGRYTGRPKTTSRSSYRSSSWGGSRSGGGK